jgi:hypothetical protein
VSSDPHPIDAKNRQDSHDGSLVLVGLFRRSGVVGLNCKHRFKGTLDNFANLENETSIEVKRVLEE